MATLRVEQAYAPQRGRRWPGLLWIWLFQLVFWAMFATLFYFLVRPHHAFPDLLLWQTAATTATGLACSVVLERLYASVQARTSRFAIFAGAPLAVVLLGLAWYALAAWIGRALDPFVVMPTTLPGGELFAPAQLPGFLAALLFWGLLFVAVVHLRDQRTQKERLSRAETLSQQAQLRMLRYQLNPHFLFNALNSISALASEAPDRVQRMIGELCGFLRYSLLDTERLEVLLRDELRAVAHYLEVEKVRFEDDLEVRIDCEPDAARRPLPAFLVLPLVENAIKHGRRTSGMPLRIEVAARIEQGSSLVIDVRNTGAWLAASRPASAIGTETGLHNVRERLRAHYSGRHAFELYEDGGWVRARIRIDDDR